MDRRFPIVPFTTQSFAPFFSVQIDDLQATLLSQGACNSNYLVDSPDHGKVVCRIYSRGNPEHEQYLTDLVADIVPVPKYLWVGEGVSVQTYIEGSPFEATSPLLKEAGQIIGRLAQISWNGSGQINLDGSIEKFDTWPTFITGISSLLATPSVIGYLDTPTLESLRKILNERRNLFNDFDHDQGLVHGDFSPNNILVSGDTIVGILDWEFAHSGSFYMDIGNLLRHLPTESETALATGLKAGGLDLPSDWRYRSQCIDLASHLEFLTSSKSHSFKLTCVDHIKAFINISKRHFS